MAITTSEQDRFIRKFWYEGLQICLYATPQGYTYARVLRRNNAEILSTADLCISTRDSRSAATMAFRAIDEWRTKQAQQRDAAQKKKVIQAAQKQARRRKVAMYVITHVSLLQAKTGQYAVVDTEGLAAYDDPIIIETVLPSP